ncbi:long-chain fatty acid--CoA ligase [Fulvivirga sp. 29W222]|uniref:Long-chain fatty acid--CoA ligase n=1 Tax=Fulvivirga marina TaxID=2494733 RepID=A0A937FV73_9BACT|nr:long-chain fatty acid--CoA ligase [Fulvivirga marina]MBL6446654.1 long-chain fatty acid--CoA ligase [Fulvivirga marina]
MHNLDWISKWATYSPDKVALKDYATKQELTYRQLNDNALKLADILKSEYGLEKGDRLMVIAEHSSLYVTLFSVAQKTGIILVPVNYRLSAKEIDYLIGNCTPKLVLYESNFQALVMQASANSQTSILNTQKLIGEMKGRNFKTDFPNSELDFDDPLFILYTSGTTGFPKGALYTHRMLFWNSMNTALSLDVVSSDFTINCMPAFHTGGWNVLITPLLHKGATIGMMNKFDADQVLSLLESEQATIYWGVPTTLKMMLESPLFENADLSSIRYFLSGGEALPLESIHQWHKKGIKIRQGYGLTEVGPNITSLHHNDAERKIGSIGRPNFYVESKLVNESGEEVKPGEIGEFCLGGNLVTAGYWNNPEATSDAIVDGWFRTGDLMKQDEEGYLYVVDRRKSMFISGGENVYPAEVERVLLSHPAINEAAVIGVKDEKWGEVGKAFIVIKKEEAPLEMELRGFCLEHLAKYKVPKYFEFISDLPKNDTGKINKKALKSAVS